MGTGGRWTKKSDAGPGLAKCGEVRLYRALDALRRASRSERRTMNAEWRYITRWLTCYAGRRPGASEAVQYALMRVSRGIDGLEARSPARAASWLRRVLTTGFHDVARDAKNEPVVAALRALSPEARDRALLRLVAPTPDRHLTPEMLDACMRLVATLVADWTAATIPSPAHRKSARLRARVALLRHLRGLDLDELRHAIGRPVARDTLYKWFERGRDDVLLPALAAWSSAPARTEEELTFAEALREALLSTRRPRSRRPRKSTSECECRALPLTRGIS